ncbi:MAG TPA: tyrosine-type recombinase/integrase [Candidatus Baltobacteraceae bacterium]|nr:tyrosine-type recombinase/integrase [Candidatus Baltobacteraceae bacterium]
MKSPERAEDREWPGLRAFNEYLLLELRRSDRTAREYIGDLKLFAAFVDPNGAADRVLLEASTSNIRQFLMDMTRRRLSAAAVRRRVAALRAFYKFAKRESLRDDNPVVEIGMVKLPGRLPKAISIKDTERLLATKPDAGMPEWQRRRDAAILELLYATGIRRAELVGIDLSDIDFEQRTIRVVGKGNKERFVIFNSYAQDALERYLAVRPPSSDGALLVSRLGRRLSYPQVGNIFRLFVRLSGLEGKISPHTMRHSFATHLHQRGVDIMTIKELLGHESVATTQIYSKVTLSHAKQAYDEAHPRNTSTKT